MRELEPGDFFLTHVQGRVGTLVNFLQGAVGDDREYGHAGIYLGDNLVAEAMPGGFQINHISKYYDRGFIYSKLDLTDDQRRGIVDLAYSLRGRPYSYLGYLFIGLSHFKRCPRWIERRVASSNAMICSQAVDYVYSQNGVRLFDDGRPFLKVRPGDLLRLVKTMFMGV